jgi:hypothetical protein
MAVPHLEIDFMVDLATALYLEHPVHVIEAKYQECPK